MLVSELFEESRGPDTRREFGFENGGNASKAKKALLDAKIEFNTSKAGGIHYFHFDTVSSAKKAMAIVKKVIDKSKESEWDSVKEELELLEKKWIKTDPEKRGMFKGKDLSDLESELANLKKSGPHKEGSPELKKMHELQFAIRAKKGHGFHKESLDEGVMDLSVHGSDSAADAWYVARKKMVDAAVAHLSTELQDEGNEFNTHGPLNVAMIIGEKFDDEDFEYSKKLHALAVRTLKLLQKPHGWERTKGYKRVVDKLKRLVSLQKD